MQKIISASELRTYIRRVLNEVGYGQDEYLIEKFGEPIAALISVEDFRLLQSLKQQLTTIEETPTNPQREL